MIAGIFDGSIKTWNASQITALNPGVTLPSNAIVPEVRADSSGTTYIFSDYLTTAAPSVWTLGKSKTITWPSTAVQTPKNSGVAASIKSTPYSIGYVELAYALQNNFTFAAVKNAAGAYVVPSQATVAADADQRLNISPTDFSIVNEPGRDQLPDLGLQLGHPAAEADQRHHRGSGGQGARLDGPHRRWSGPGRRPGLCGAPRLHPELQPDHPVDGDRTERAGAAHQVAPWVSTPTP